MAHTGRQCGLPFPLLSWALARSQLCPCTAGLEVGHLQDWQQQLEGILDVRGAVAALGTGRQETAGLFSKFRLARLSHLTILPGKSCSIGSTVLEMLVFQVNANPAFWMACGQVSIYTNRETHSKEASHSHGVGGRSVCAYL